MLVNPQAGGASDCAAHRHGALGVLLADDVKRPSSETISAEKLVSVAGNLEVARCRHCLQHAGTKRSTTARTGAQAIERSSIDGADQTDRRAEALGRFRPSRERSSSIRIETRRNRSAPRPAARRSVTSMFTKQGEHRQHEGRRLDAAGAEPAPIIAASGWTDRWRRQDVEPEGGVAGASRALPVEASQRIAKAKTLEPGRRAQERSMFASKTSGEAAMISPSTIATPPLVISKPPSRSASAEPPPMGIGADEGGSPEV